MTTSTPDGSATAQPTRVITLRELLHDRAFALYLIGQTTSGLGSALSSVALVFAVLSISRSASSVGLVLLVSRLPGIVLSLTGGVIADRWSRKWIAVCADAARTALQLASGVLLLSGHATIPDLAALQFASGGASALFGPAANALLAGIAPQGQIRRASSLLGIIKATAQTGGLAASGLIVALAGPGTSLLIDGVTFGVSSATLALIPAIRVLSPPTKKLLADLTDAWRVVTSHRWLGVYAVHETILNVLILSPFFVLGPVIAKAHLGGAPAWSAIALGYAIGNIAAANVTYRWAPQRPVLVALAISVALAPMLALIGLAAPIWLIAPAALLAGAQTTIYDTLLNAAIQANLPQHTLGRASAITGIGSTILVPVGMGLSGVLAGYVGASTVMVAGAVLTVVTTGICLLLPATGATLQLDRRD